MDGEGKEGCGRWDWRDGGGGEKDMKGKKGVDGWREGGGWDGCRSMDGW